MSFSRGNSLGDGAVLQELRRVADDGDPTAQVGVSSGVLLSHRSGQLNR